MRSVDMTHKTIVKRRHFTDKVLARQLLKTIQREDDVEVFVGIAVIIVIVRDAHGLVGDISRDDAIGRGPPGCLPY